MNAKMVSDAISEVDGKYIDEALFYNAKAGRPRRFHRLPAALIAAVLALLLIGTAVAVTLISGNSIQSWLIYRWEEITGQAMSEEHRAVIESLGQEIGVSQTVGDVTVHVDSATVGDDRTYLLLKVTGIDISDRHPYGFQMATMKTAPDPVADGAFSGWGMKTLGVNGDGEWLLLMTCEYLNEDGFVQDTRPLQVWLRFQNIARDQYTDKERIIAEGEWNLSFVIDRSQPIEAIIFPDIEIAAIEIGSLSYAEVPVTITNLNLTNTGLRFQYHAQNGTIFLQEQKIAVILKNGTIIEGENCMSVMTKDNIDMRYSFRWEVPLNLNEVAAIQFGETQIEIP